MGPGDTMIAFTKGPGQQAGTDMAWGLSRGEGTRQHTPSPGVPVFSSTLTVPP